MLASIRPGMPTIRFGDEADSDTPWVAMVVESGPDVGHSQRDELPVRVDVVAVLRGEAARGDHRAVVTDERQSDRAQRELQLACRLRVFT